MDVTFIQTSNSFCRKTLGSITILLALCVLESQVDAQELISGEKSLTDHHLLLHHRRTRKNAFEKLDQPLLKSAVRIKGVHCIAASSLQTALVVRDLDNKKNPKLIELETGKVIYDFPELTQEIISAAFSPDGTLLGVTSYESSLRERALRIWKIGKKVELSSKTMPLKDALWDGHGEMFMSNNIKKIVVLNSVNDVWLIPENKKNLFGS